MGWSRWIRTVEIEPAVDAGDSSARLEHIDALLRSGCRVFHLNLHDATALPYMEHDLAPLVHRYEGVVDVHIGGDPYDLAGPVAAAGGDSLTFGADAVDDIGEAIAHVHLQGLQAGVGVGAADDADAVAAVAHDADVVLIAGRDGGMDSLIRRMKVALPSAVAIQVEGGVTPESVRDLYDAGATLLVAKEAIFAREDLPRAYRRLVHQLA